MTFDAPEMSARSRKSKGVRSTAHDPGGKGGPFFALRVTKVPATLQT